MAAAEPGRAKPGYQGEIVNTPKGSEEPVAKLSEGHDGGLPQLCYEAGTCGYLPYRQTVDRMMPVLPEWLWPLG